MRRKGTVLDCEDDVKIEQLPKLSDIELLKDKKGREIGMCSMMANWDDHNHMKYPDILDHLRDKTNYTDNGDSVFWLKDEKYKNTCWVVFPVIIMKTDLMYTCLHNAEHGKQIEEGYSDAWFQLGYNRNYGMVTYMRKFDCSDITIEEARFTGKFTNELIYVKTLDIEWCKTQVHGGRNFL